MPFKDRVDAGRKLATALRKFKGQDVVVLALPHGRVPIAAEIAAALQRPESHQQPIPISRRTNP